MTGGAPKAKPVLVGRQRELDSLWNQFEQSMTGRLRVALVAGEPGIGKTRLLREVARRAEQAGAPVLRGGASEAEGMPPYLPFLEALCARRPGQWLPCWLRSCLNSRYAWGNSRPVTHCRPNRRACASMRLWACFSLPLLLPTACCSFSTICSGPTPPRSTCSVTWHAPSRMHACWSWAPTAKARSRIARPLNVH